MADTDTLLETAEQEPDYQLEVQERRPSVVPRHKSKSLVHKSEKAVQEAYLQTEHKHQLEQAELDHRKIQIRQQADKILRSPLHLVPIPQTHRPFARHLERAKLQLKNGGDAHEAFQECQRATALLGLDREFHLSDQGLIWLFQAGISSNQGDFEQAQDLAKRAYQYLPNGSNPHRVVARLIQGNSCTTNGINSVLEGEVVYGEVIQDLKKLKLIEGEKGNKHQAELYRALEEGVQQRLGEVQRLTYHPRKKLREVVQPQENGFRKRFLKSPPSERLEVISPSPYRQIPIIDEVAAGLERPVSDDDILGYIQQTGDLDFEYEGRTLKFEFLRRKSQLTFSEEYDYVAVQVSGDSMDRAGIAPNDYVILQRPKLTGLHHTSGDIVAVVFRDEDDKATLKRILIRSSDVIFKPESSNPEHQLRIFQPQDFVGDNPRIVIVGIAVAVLGPQEPDSSHFVVLPQQDLNEHRRIIDFRFPDECKLGEPVVLSIQLMSQSIRRKTDISPVELTIFVSVDNFEVDQYSKRMVAAPGQDSERIEFELISQVLGPQIVEVEIFLRTTRVGYVVAKTQVVSGATAGQDDHAILEQVDDRILFALEERPEPDVVIRVNSHNKEIIGYEIYNTWLLYDRYDMVETRGKESIASILDYLQRLLAPLLNKRFKEESIRTDLAARIMC
jgi:hypothetical protein